MASLNKVILIGNLVADPELKKTPNGISVTSFRIAVGRRFTRDGEAPQADFIDIVACLPCLYVSISQKESRFSSAVRSSPETGPIKTVRSAILSRLLPTKFPSLSARLILSLALQELTTESRLRQDPLKVHRYPTLLSSRFHPTMIFRSDQVRNGTKF